VVRLERYCRRADIVATDLGPNIIDIAGDQAAAGQFLQVVAANLARGCSYRFLLAGDDDELSRAVARFQDLITQVTGGDPLAGNSEFRRTVLPIMGGCGLYELDTGVLAMEEPALLAQFANYLSDGHHIGYLNRPNNDSRSDMLMSPVNTEHARVAFEELWNAGRPLPRR
jgi:hypothetical protein